MVLYGYGLRRYALFASLAWVMICHDTTMILTVWVTLERQRREPILATPPARLAAPLPPPVGAWASSRRDRRCLTPRATVSATTARRSTEMTAIVAARRPEVHLEQAYPMSEVYPSAHTAQTGGPGGDDVERDRAGAAY